MGVVITMCVSVYIVHCLLQFKEMRTDSGDVVIQPQAELGLGFCPDLQPDREVGVVMERLIVGSVDVAHDFFLLKQLSVTHILNTAAGVPNAFPNVICPACCDS